MIYDSLKILLKFRKKLTFSWEMLGKTDDWGDFFLIGRSKPLWNTNIVPIFSVSFFNYKEWPTFNQVETI